MSDERKFMHDLSGPLAGAIFSLEIALEELYIVLPADSQARRQLDTVRGSLEKARVLLQERRQLLVDRDRKAG